MTNKKLSSIITIATIAVGFVFGYNATEKEQENPAPVVEQVQSNVGDGQTYVYEITDVDWTTDEIHGVPMNKESYTNKGIFLYGQEVPFDVEVGDRIAVVWGETEDEFASIERALQAEDGSWVGESFYK